jgi:hypothetical protein
MLYKARLDRLLLRAAGREQSWRRNPTKPVTANNHPTPIPVGGLNAAGERETFARPTAIKGVGLT